MFNLDILEEQGYRIIGASPIKKMTIENISDNTFAYFESFDKLGFSFITFPDQLIEIHSPMNGVFKVFGKCHFGCLTIAENKQMYLITYSDECFITEKVFANSSLTAFLSSYSLFMSKIFILKSVFHDKDTLVLTATEEAIKLTKEIEKIDKIAVAEHTFWEQMIYIIDDLIVKLDINIMDYIDSGRCG